MKFQFERHRRTILTINITTVAQIIRTSIPGIMESKGDTIAITSSF
jgi:NADP-dependent 3-hydroxy acid dehydrogenase YdfG